MDKVESLVFGALVLARRSNLGMSQQELSIKTGINRVTLARYETGKSNAGLASASKVFNALGLSLGDYTNLVNSLNEITTQQKVKSLLESEG